jgi:hypothetical protein
MEDAPTPRIVIGELVDPPHLVQKLHNVIFWKITAAWRRLPVGGALSGRKGGKSAPVFAVRRKVNDRGGWSVRLALQFDSFAIA